jgi:phenylalanyl-tRNA synthetase beta chain
MKISYNWLKWYIPEIPDKDKMWGIFTYHLCEVESVENLPDGDVIFDINILPNRAHDLLSHQGIARELASLLNIPYVDPTPKYKIPDSKSTNLQIKVESDKCRRYTARIVRDVKVTSSPDWVVKHLESIGQRSINNMVDAANIVMYDCGQPIHVFDLDKLRGSLIIRLAKEGEEITTLDNKLVKLKTSDLVIADEENALAIAGVKGGKVAEVDENTKNIIIEIGNFDPTSVRKTGRGAGIFTDALKRFENDLSPELCDFAMLEMSGLLVEYGCEEFEDVVDVYENKQPQRNLSFSLNKISKMLGIEITKDQMTDILNRYNFKYSQNGDLFEIAVPAMRLDLTIEEDMAEEVGRVIGYDKVTPVIPKIEFKNKQNEVYNKIIWARDSLLKLGYSEVMTYAFSNKGEVEVLQSASDKKFLRTNLKDGLTESLKLNRLNQPLLDTKEVKVFEIGTVFFKDKEEIHIAYGDKKEIKEQDLDEFIGTSPEFSSESTNIFLLENFSARLSQPAQGFHNQNPATHFTPWSQYPFIVRDIAVWVPEGEGKDKLEKLLKDNVNELCIKSPELFDSFTKEGKTSFGFRMIFQSYDRTLTDEEINTIMDNITNKIKANPDWQVR